MNGVRVAVGGRSGKATHRREKGKHYAASRQFSGRKRKRVANRVCDQLKF